MDTPTSTDPTEPEDPIELKVSSALPPPARCDQGANHIPGLVLGIRERGRQEAIKGA
jgi:hypothetical protein